MQTTINKTSRWRVVDIVVASVIGVAAGIIFWAWGVAYGPLSALMAATPGLSALLGGGWLFAGVLGGLVIRKPGAAIYTEVIAATVSALVGTQWGFDTLVSGLLQGLGAEIVFAIFLYKKWNIVTAILAGAAASLFMSAHDLVVWYAGVDVTFQVVYIISGLISGVVLAGIVPWYIVKGLARAGALTRFASGR